MHIKRIQTCVYVYIYIYIYTSYIYIYIHAGLPPQRAAAARVKFCYCSR